MLNLTFSNRFEALADRPVARIGEHAISIFDTDTVIVPSTAVRRALTLRIVDAQGICAGVDWQYLAQWLWRELGPRVGGGRTTMPAGGTSTSPARESTSLPALSQRNRKSSWPKCVGSRVTPSSAPPSSHDAGTPAARTSAPSPRS